MKNKSQYLLKEKKIGIFENKIKKIVFLYISLNFIINK